MTIIPSGRPLPVALSPEQFWDKARRHLTPAMALRVSFRRSLNERRDATSIPKMVALFFDLHFRTDEFSVRACLSAHRRNGVILRRHSRLFISGMVIRPPVDLTEALSRTLPESLSEIVLLSTGSESNRTVIKMSKLYAKKHEIVTFDQSYHGSTHAVGFGTYSVSSDGNGPVAPGPHYPHPKFEPLGIQRCVWTT